jgi:hypothetical protein
MELITITISRDTFNLLLDNNLLGEFTIKEVYVKDEMFKDDERHKALIKALVKAKEAVKDYEFKRRHNI